jgi:predicted RNA binding protein YcfA (HicA-like mRNA interferase family)
LKLPRDVSGEDLARRLCQLGYEVTRQTGSHMRLARIDKTEHRITIPAHDPLKVGTLNSILKDIAAHLGISRDELLRQLWGTGA